MDIIVYIGQGVKAQALIEAFSKNFDDFKRYQSVDITEIPLTNTIEITLGPNRRSLGLNFRIHFVRNTEELVHLQEIERADCTSLLVVGEPEEASMDRFSAYRFLHYRQFLPAKAADSQLHHLTRHLLEVHLSKMEEAKAVARANKPAPSNQKEQLALDLEHHLEWIAKLKGEQYAESMELQAINRILEKGEWESLSAIEKEAFEQAPKQKAEKEKALKYYEKRLAEAEEKRLDLQAGLGATSAPVPVSTTATSSTAARKLSFTPASPPKHNASFFSPVSVQPPLQPAVLSLNAARESDADTHLRQALIGYVRAQLKRLQSKADKQVIKIDPKKLVQWVILTIEHDLKQEVSEAAMNKLLTLQETKPIDFTAILQINDTLDPQIRELEQKTKKMTPLGLAGSLEIPSDEGKETLLIAHKIALLQVMLSFLEQPEKGASFDVTLAQTCEARAKFSVHNQTVQHILHVLEAQVTTLVAKSKVLISEFASIARSLSEAYPELGALNLNVIPDDEASQKDFFKQYMQGHMQATEPTDPSVSVLHTLSPTQLLERILDKNDLFFKVLHAKRDLLNPWEPEIVRGFRQFCSTAIDREAVVIPASGNAVKGSFWDTLARNARDLLKHETGNTNNAGK
jgi:hypothetical protein